MAKIKISCHVFDKKSGEQVFKGFKNGYAVFDSLEEFYSYMAIRYGFTSRNYDILISGCYI